MHPLTKRLAPEPGFMEGATLLARQPQTLGNHPSPQRFASNSDPMTLLKNFNRQCRSEVRVPGHHQLNGILPDGDVHPPVRCLPTRERLHMRFTEVLLADVLRLPSPSWKDGTSRSFGLNLRRFHGRRIAPLGATRCAFASLS